MSVYGQASHRSRCHSVCGRLGASVGGMPLAGALRDLDEDGSLYRHVDTLEKFAK